MGPPGLNGPPCHECSSRSANEVFSEPTRSEKMQLGKISAAVSMILSAGVMAKTDKPNIVVIFGDDIGWQNVSAYGMGTMGYTTPNIDRIAKEGIKFTDHYAQPSSTAGRAAFLTGQYPIRSGMTTVAMPGGALGLKKESPSLAEVLKAVGYKTGQFGKNHLGGSQLCPADRPRLRRILRQPLSPQYPGRTRATGLPEFCQAVLRLARGVQQEVRYPRRPALLCHRDRRQDG